jgi:hypothetical protein
MVGAIADLRTLSSDATMAIRNAQEQIAKSIEQMTREWERHISRFDGIDEKMAQAFGALSEQITIQTEQMRRLVLSELGAF